MEGVYPHQTSYSIMLKIALVRIQLWIYVTIVTISTQNL
jgi:hypothetical protein